MSELSVSVFNFDTHAIRTVTDDATGEPLFVGKDVCEALGYARPSNAMQDHCKGAPIRSPLQTAGGVQEVRVLTEPDVLRLIVSSTLPAAERFEKWVFEEVLPSIRKTGQYIAYEKSFEKSFEKLDHSLRAIERISTTLDYTSDRVFEVTMRELERLGHPEWAESFIKTGQLNVGEEHIAWTKLETLAAKLAKELVKAQKSAKKRQTPFAELSPEEYAAITTEWRKKHLPYSLVTDPAHKGQATQHALTNNTGQRKLTH